MKDKIKKRLLVTNRPHLFSFINKVTIIKFKFQIQNKQFLILKQLALGLERRRLGVGIFGTSCISCSRRLHIRLRNGNEFDCALRNKFLCSVPMLVMLVFESALGLGLADVDPQVAVLVDCDTNVAFLQAVQQISLDRSNQLLASHLEEVQEET
jgi:hypothetical protein